MSNSKFSTKSNNIVFSSFMMWEELWPEDRLNAQWISLANYSIREMTDVIIRAVRDQSQSKNIVVASFQKFAGAYDVQKIVQHLDEIAEAVESQRKNKVSFATCYFVPAHQSVWGAVSILNKQIHRICDQLRISRINLHKCVMREVDEKRDDGWRMIKPSCWLEYQLGLSLGTNLSWEGCLKIKYNLLKVFDFTFNDDPYRPPSKKEKINSPLPLNKTPGYKEDSFMIQMMELKKMIPTRTRSEGERMLKCSEVKNNPRCKYWRIYQENGPMISFESREGMLEACHIQLKRSHTIREWEQPIAHQDQQMDQAVQQEVIDVSDISVDEVEDEIRHVSIQEEHDDVFAPEEEERGEKQKRKHNENEDLQDEIDNLKDAAEELRNELKEKERLLAVEEEKVKSYSLTLGRERAAVKVWKGTVDKERARNDELLKSLEKEQKTSRHTKRVNKRLIDEYYYLRGLYETSGHPSKSKVNVKYAKKKDLAESSDEED